MSAKYNVTVGNTWRTKAGGNPSGLRAKAIKTTPGSPGANAIGVVMKKRASLLLRRNKP